MVSLTERLCWAFWNIVDLILGVGRRWGYLLLAGILGLGLFFTRDYWITYLQEPIQNRIAASSGGIEIAMWIPNRIRMGPAGETNIEFELKVQRRVTQGLHNISIQLNSPDPAVYFKPSSNLVFELTEETKSTATIVGYRQLRNPPKQFSITATIQEGVNMVASLEGVIVVDPRFSGFIAPASTILQTIALMISIVVGLKNLLMKSNR